MKHYILKPHSVPISCEAGCEYLNLDCTYSATGLENRFSVRATISVLVSLN